MTRGSRSPLTTPDSGRPGGRPRILTRARPLDVRSPATPVDDDPAPVPPGPARRLRVNGLQVNSGRALALVGVVVVLALSYASTVRVYLDQQHALAVMEQQIRDQRTQLADLEAQLARWDDPAFVKAQARERLGWVLPGETGYRVVDANGKPVDGGAVIDSERTMPADERPKPWWGRMWGSVEAADAPAPVK